jgi:hypothetical protein
VKDEETQEQVLKTGTEQPHRRGQADPRDPRLESPLGRFCVMHGLSSDLYGAGVSYRNIVLEARQAKGLPNCGGGPGGWRGSEVDDAEAAKRVASTKAREDESDAVLKRIRLVLPRRMKDICVLEITHNPSDSNILRDGLVALHAIYSTGRKKRY